MKKLFFLFAALLLLVGCAQQRPVVQDTYQPPAQQDVAPTAPYVEPTPPVEAAPDQPRDQTVSSVSRGEYASHQSPDLQNAFTEGMRLCNYKLTDAVFGDILIKVWILNSERFRLEKAVPGNRISTIYDQLIIHSWDDRTKQGVRVNMNDLASVTDERVAGIAIPKSPAEATAGARDVICVPSTAISEDILDVPDNVNFVSLGTLAEPVAEQ
jgi:hypothetical protein